MLKVFPLVRYRESFFHEENFQGFLAVEWKVGLVVEHPGVGKRLSTGVFLTFWHEKSTLNFALTLCKPWSYCHLHRSR